MIRVAALAMIMALPAAAQSPVDSAIDAAEALDAARTGLEAAEGTQDRVAALTRTVLAYESGLSALRSAIRRITVQRDIVQTAFDTEAAEVSAVLAALQANGDPAAPARILHPAGPLAGARATMLIAGIVGPMQAEADAIEARLRELQTLDDAARQAETALDIGLEHAVAARLDLSATLGSDTSKPDIPDAIVALVDAGRSLQDIALALAESAEAGALIDGPAFADAMGTLSPPATGTSSGRSGDGINLITLPRALLTAPWDVTVRYSGHLRGYGNVMILEPAPGYLVVLSGMAETFGTPGVPITQGAPIGMMGGTETRGESETETLYIELRHHGQPLDPATWFALDEERN